MTDASATPMRDWDGTPVPPALWGKDHWTTFAYAFTQAGRFLDMTRMRREGDKYPTRLRDGSLLRGHNDLACLYDMKAVGLLTDLGTIINPRPVFSVDGLLLGQWLVEFIDIRRGNTRDLSYVDAFTCAGIAHLLEKVS